MASKREEMKAFKKLCKSTRGYSTLDFEMRRDGLLEIETRYRAYNGDTGLSEYFPTPMEAVDALLKGEGQK